MFLIFYTAIQLCLLLLQRQNPFQRCNVTLWLRCFRSLSQVRGSLNDVFHNSLFRDDASKTVRLSSFLLACAKPNLESSGVSPKGIPFKLTPPGFHSRKMGRKMTRKVVLTWVCPPTEGDKKEKKTQSETGSENWLVPHRAGGGGIGTQFVLDTVDLTSSTLPGAWKYPTITVTARH